MSRITQLSQVLEKNTEVLVIDLLNYVMTLEEQLLQALVDPPKGIYIVGSIDPIIRTDQAYYARCSYGNPDQAIKTLEDIFSMSDDIVDSKGHTVLTARDIRTKKKYLRTEPTIPVTAVKLAIGLVLKYLNNLCSHTRVDYTNYRQELFVKEEFKELIVREEFVIAFERLIDQVMEFVGKDVWHIYFYKVKGTSLVIEKTCDFRIYDWHRIQLERDNPDIKD